MPKILYKTGAYAWVNKVNGRRYIGGAYKSFDDRFRDHQRALNKGNHWNSHFQNAWNKYGAKAFVFQILERCPPVKEEIQKVEQKWIDRYWTEDRRLIYNSRPKAESNLGFRPTVESRRKMSKSASKALPELWKDPGYREKVMAGRQGKAYQEDRRSKIAETLRRRCQEPEIKAIRSKASKAVWADPEVRKKQSEALRQAWSDADLRKEQSERVRKRYNNPEYRAKMKAVHKKTMSSPDYGTKMSALLRERWANPEFRAKMKAKMSSPEVVAKLSAKTRANWEDPEYRARATAANQEIGRKLIAKNRAQASLFED